MTRFITVLAILYSFIPLFYGQNEANITLDQAPVKISWITPQAAAGRIGKYNRLELGIEIPQHLNRQIDEFLNGGKSDLNPFDPDLVNVVVQLTSPSGKKYTRYAFYYEEFYHDVKSDPTKSESYRNQYVRQNTKETWRFRFAPDELGVWKMTLDILIRKTSALEKTIDYSFECVASDHKGYLTVLGDTSENNRWMYYSETGEPFYAIGENLASAGECGYFPSQNKRHLEALRKFITAGGNFARFELGGQSALPDYPVHNNYFGKLDEMHAFDRILTECENNGVYFILFRHHVEALLREDWADVRWQQNPYREVFGLKSVEEYFTNKEAIEWQRKCLRYIYARWGYSPNMAFYGYSEVDNWYSEIKKEIEKGTLNPEKGITRNPEKDPESYAAARLKNWIEEHQNYIRTSLNENAKFCHTYASVGHIEDSPVTSFFELSDIIGLHSYGEMKDANFKRRYDYIAEYRKKYNKPVVLEEIGPNKIAMFCCTGIEFHNSAWSSAMMGGLGTGMDWWWDRGVFDMGYEKDLKGISDFFEKEDLIKGNYTPQKWADVNGYKKRTLENFALVSENGEKALGWVHNATYYWRNLADSNECLQNLIDGKVELNDPCYFAKDKHGHPFQKFGTPCPWNHDDVYVHEDISGFDKEECKDAFTESGGARPIVKKESRENPHFLVKGLKSSGGIKKHWYRVEFYSTNGTGIAHRTALNKVIKSNGSGNLKIEVPDLDGKNPDYAYKVNYIGKYSKKEMKSRMADEKPSK